MVVVGGAFPENISIGGYTSRALGDTRESLSSKTVPTTDLLAAPGRSGEQVWRPPGLWTEGAGQLLGQAQHLEIPLLVKGHTTPTGRNTGLGDRDRRSNVTVRSPCEQKQD